MDDADGNYAYAFAGVGYAVGGANAWNPAGWIILGTMIVATGAAVYYSRTNAYHKNKKQNIDPYARPGQKKQGRELKNKNRQKSNFRPKHSPKKPKKHTPGRDHRKYSKNKKKK